MFKKIKKNKKSNQDEEGLVNFVMSHMINAKIHKAIGLIIAESEDVSNFDIRGKLSIEVDFEDDRIAWVLEREGKRLICSDRQREVVI